MTDEMEFEYVTTDAAVEVHDSSTPIFSALLTEVRELSRKKPEATMSASKVKVINRVLVDLLSILQDEPAGKYLFALEDDSLPQVSDAVLTMVQFEAAIEAFRSRYHQRVHSTYYWITSELLETWGEDDEETDSGDNQDE